MWKIIKEGTKLPDDFVVDGEINREDYVLETYFEKEDKSSDEYKTIASLEIIGAIVIGSKNYHLFRFRKRTTEDKPWNKFDQLHYKIMQNKLI